MPRIGSALFSTVGQKYLMAISGLALIAFLVFHLFGNLLTLSPNASAYNAFSNFLVDLGIWLYLAELLLLFLILLHTFIAVRLKLMAKRARTIDYMSVRTKDGPSKSGFASKNMMLTGLALLVFLVVHIAHFKYGPGVPEGYSVETDGKQVRDLYRLVMETFHQPAWAGAYVGAMILLGFHLRHGFWSAFQSLGATRPTTTSLIEKWGAIVAFFLAGGFALIPLWTYFNLTEYVTGMLK